MSDSLPLHRLQHGRLPCSLSPDSCPLSQCWYLTISSSVTSFSFCLQPFPASGSLPMSCPCASGGQTSKASALVLPVNIQEWFPLGFTYLISLFKGLSKVFSSTTVWSISFLAHSLLYSPTLTPVHDYWKNHSFDYMELLWKNDVSAF